MSHAINRYLSFIFSAIFSFPIFAQQKTIVTHDHTKIEVLIINDSVKQGLLSSFNAKQDNSLRKQWTARTFRLSDDRIIVEFYDKQAVVIKNIADFEKLREIRFTKNYIDFLKRDITYKIDISVEKGEEISKTGERLTTLNSDISEYHYFEVYELSTGQILFLSKNASIRSATIYENMKGLCSDNTEIESKFYQGMDQWSEKLVNGDPLTDYDVNGYLVYPKDIKALIVNHHLSLVETKVYVNQFYGNLYKSSNGYYILIDDVNQKNGAGKKMPILTVRTYDNLQMVKDAEAKFQSRKGKKVISEYLYQKISDQYGKDFPLYTQKLIDSLPVILNFEKEQLTFDSIGMAIVDEAIHWNHSNFKLFNKWFPSVLAYYGQCYMTIKKDGNWVIKLEDGVWTPYLVLSNNEDVFDPNEFFSDLIEWPIPIKAAGDWDGSRKRLRKNMKANSQ